VAETTCLGAAYAAGIASGYWSGREDLYNNWEEDITWYPDMEKEVRQKGYQGWKKAVARTLDWEE
jgi:glycerol kinase